MISDGPGHSGRWGLSGWTTGQSPRSTIVDGEATFKLGFGVEFSEEQPAPAPPVPLIQGALAGVAPALAAGQQQKVSTVDFTLTPQVGFTPNAQAYTIDIVVDTLDKDGN